MHRTRFWLPILLALLASACIGGPDEPAGPTPAGASPPVDPARFHVRIFLEDDPLLVPELIAEAARVWRSEDVSFEIVSVPGLAVAAMEVSDDSCVFEENGDFMLAVATSPPARITVFRDCMAFAARNDPVRTEELLVTMATHELGHLLGIWLHVPARCDDPDADIEWSANGTPICGRAAMNPSNDRHLRGLITAIDHLAFESLRTSQNAVIGTASSALVPPGAASPRCEYRARD